MQRNMKNMKEETCGKEHEGRNMQNMKEGIWRI
jgi:hypothetical protein